jgi:hypothetical protein
MDDLHSMLSSICTETKSGKDHLNVFREFLAHLDQLQRKAPVKAARAKAPMRRKVLKRVKAG